MEREFNQAEEGLRKKMAAHARRLAVESGLPDPGEHPLRPEQLDQLWANWNWEAQEEQGDRPIGVAFFGFALGECLVPRTNSSWRIVIDEYGEDFALVSPAGVTAFPLAIVLKRYGGPPFFTALVPALAKDLISPSPGPPATNPWWKFWG